MDDRQTKGINLYIFLENIIYYNINFEKFASMVASCNDTLEAEAPKEYGSLGSLKLLNMVTLRV